LSKLEHKITIESGKNTATIEFHDNDISVTFEPVINIKEILNDDEKFCISISAYISNIFTKEEEGK
jgi:hypothetical protein